MFALIARHMIAARIFLNRLVAFWASLSVGHNPSDVFWLSWEFLLPPERSGAVAGKVWVGGAKHAEGHAAFAVHIALKIERRLFEAVFTAFLRAPLYRVIQVGVALAEFFPVSVLEAWSQKFKLLLMPKNYVAALLHTLGVWLVIVPHYESFSVFLPAGIAKSMTALKCKFVLIIKWFIAAKANLFFVDCY